MAGQQVVVSVLGDIRDFSQKMSQTAETANKTFAGVTGAVVGSKMFAALKDIGGQVLDAMKGYGDDLDALSDQLGADAADAFTSGFASTVKGANIQEAMGIGSELAKTITGTLGMAGDEARKLTETYTQGVLDIAASTNTSSEQATTAITQFLQGKDKAIAKTLGMDADLIKSMVKQKMTTEGLTETQARQAVAQELMAQRAGEAEADTKTFSGSVKEMTDAFEDGGTVLVQTLLPHVQEFSDFLVSTIVPAVQDAATWIKENKELVTGLAVGVAILVGAFQLLSGALTVISAIQTLTGILKTLEITTKLSSAAQWLLNAAMSANPIMIIVLAIAALVAGLIWFFTQTEVGKKAWEIFTKTLTALWTTFTTFIGGAWKTITGFFTQAGDNVKKAWDLVMAWFAGLPKKIQAFFDNLPENLKRIGTDLLMGLWNGINDKVGWIRAKISGFVDSVTSWFKGFFGIKSPSTVMADLGKYLPLGLAKGIDSEAGSVEAAMAGLAGIVTGTEFATSLAAETLRRGGTVLVLNGDIEVEAANSEEAEIFADFAKTIQRKTKAGV